MNTMFVVPRRWLACAEWDRAASPVRDEIDAMCHSQRQNDGAGEQAKPGILPGVELSATETAYTLSMEIPGVDPEAVTLEVREESLVIAGEKRCELAQEARRISSERVYGEFRRMWSLPEDADAASITAAHKNGVLTVTVPRTVKQEPQPRSIEIIRQ